MGDAVIQKHIYPASYRSSCTVAHAEAVAKAFDAGINGVPH